VPQNTDEMMKHITAFLRDSPLPRAAIGHLWVFRTEVARWEGEPSPEHTVFVKTQQGRFLGSAVYSPNSNIALRIFSRQKLCLEQDLLRKKFESAIASRSFTGKETLRLIWSEADGVPGLTVDVYSGKAVVFQITHAAIEEKRDWVLQTIEELLQPEILVERSEGPGRKKEGLPERIQQHKGTIPIIQTKIGNALFEINLLTDQKTGAYLDQAHNYRRVAAVCAGKSVLDCFCYKGGFAIHCALAGAKKVVAVDSSKEALESLNKSALLNNVTVETCLANVFDNLRHRQKSREIWDVLILDPPPFARSHSNVTNALRGYREINLRALKLLPPGGILATYTCSYHIQPHEFLQVLREAANDARKEAVVLEEHYQSPDHPILLAMPESKYLHGWLLQVL